MRKTLCIFVVLQCLFCIELYSQHIKKTIFLPEFSVTNPELFSILDSVTAYERICPYYNDSVFLLFQCREIESVTVLTIYSLISINNPLDFFEFSDIIGYFNHDGFVVFIDRKSRDLFFALKGNEKAFNYLKYDDTYQPKDNLILYYIIDDSYSVWSFYYIDDSFILNDKYICD